MSESNILTFSGTCYEVISPVLTKNAFLKLLRPVMQALRAPQGPTDFVVFNSPIICSGKKK
jgi:hypothetical protein